MVGSVGWLKSSVVNNFVRIPFHHSVSYLVNPGSLVAALLRHHHLEEAAHHGLLVENLDCPLSGTCLSILGIPAVLTLHQVCFDAIAEPAE